MAYPRRGGYYRRRFRLFRVLAFALLVGLVVGGWEPVLAAVAFGFPLLVMGLVILGAFGLLRLSVRRGSRRYPVMAPAPVPVPRPAPAASSQP